MRFSVIVPVYNVEAYLKTCVDSVIAQTCSDYELILVDDGSTDHSGALCDRLAAKTGCHVVHQENGGLGAARNTGIATARGDYLVFLDSDDFLSPDALSGLSAEIDRCPADIYSFGFITNDGHQDLTAFRDQLPYHTPLTLADHPQLLLTLPNAWCRAVRRQLFLSSGIRFPARVWFEDIRTTMKLFAVADSVVSLPDVWYHYVQREGSITRMPTSRETTRSSMPSMTFWTGTAMPVYLQHTARSWSGSASTICISPPQSGCSAVIPPILC